MQLYPPASRPKKCYGRPLLDTRLFDWCGAEVTARGIYVRAGTISSVEVTPSAPQVELIPWVGWLRSLQSNNQTWINNWPELEI